MPAEAAGFFQIGARMVAWRAATTHAEKIGPATLLAVLRALVAMARTSRRHEADVGSALQGAGLLLEPEQRDAALNQLLESECIERIIPLTDGGILVSVTATGMGRASSA